MRHGKQLLAKTGWITPAEMERWIELYNLSEVAIDKVVAVKLDQVGSARCIVGSTARRALSSLKMLEYTPLVTDAVFCEAQLPFARQKSEYWSINVYKHSEAMQMTQNKTEIQPC